MRLPAPRALGDVPRATAAGPIGSPRPPADLVTCLSEQWRTVLRKGRRRGNRRQQARHSTANNGAAEREHAEDNAPKGLTTATDAAAGTGPSDSRATASAVAPATAAVEVADENGSTEPLRHSRKRRRMEAAARATSGATALGVTRLESSVALQPEMGVTAGAPEVATAAPSRAHVPTRPLHQLTRLTLSVPSMRAGGTDLYAGNPALASYDIVAVVPGDVAVLRAAAACGAVDIIALDVSDGRPPFPLRADTLAPAIDAGLAIELSYAPAVRDTGATRRAFFSTAASLAHALAGGGSGGRGPTAAATRAAVPLLSSGATSALELRAPRDAAALVALGGLGCGARSGGLAAIGAARALAHAETRLARGSVASAARHASRTLVPASCGVFEAAKSSGETPAAANATAATHPFMASQKARGVR